MTGRKVKEHKHPDPLFNKRVKDAVRKVNQKHKAMSDKEELTLWREFKSICNSIEDKNGRDLKPVQLKISSVRVMKTLRINEIIHQLGLVIWIGGIPCSKMKH